jgi:archaemetzincin
MARPLKTGEHCQHKQYIVETSKHAAVMGFSRSSPVVRPATSIASSRLAEPRPKVQRKHPKTEAQISESALVPRTFPAPLVLPGDEMTLDPRCPAQSLQSWMRSRYRNQVTERKNTIYVASAQKLEDTSSHLINFISPYIDRRNKSFDPGEEICEPPRPLADRLTEYLSAFYHGVPVKRLDRHLEITLWRHGANYRADCEYVGLNTGTEIVRVRNRFIHSPFTCQLNLNDLLDAAESILPEDAYALLLVVDHDLYEDGDGPDSFSCGRAYGGRRISVVSTARYNPMLDATEKIDRAHAWPASHCTSYVERCCQLAEDAAPGQMSLRAKSVRTKGVGKSTSSAAEELPTEPTPLSSAIAAFAARPMASNKYPLYLSRVCRAASHKLAHCFGIDHCMYYACLMQASANPHEHARQPPYLCPIDLEKLIRTTGTTEKRRYRALLAVCKKWEEEGMFRAYRAWITGRLKELDEPVERAQKHHIDKIEVIEVGK